MEIRAPIGRIHRFLKQFWWHAKFWLPWALLGVAFQVLVGGRTLGAAVWGTALYFLQVTLLIVGCELFGRIFPRATRLWNRIWDASFGLLIKATPDKMEAWSARAVVTLIAWFGLMTLVFTASDGWRAVVGGMFGGTLMAVCLWALMSWTDTLQARAKTGNQRAWAAAQWLVVVVVGWLGFITIVLAFTHRYA